MPSIYELIPDHELLLDLSLEELGGVVLEYLHSLPENSPHFSLHDFSLPSTVKEYPSEHQDNIIKALREAWQWLEIEVLIVRNPTFSSDRVFISRQGQKLKNAVDVEAYRRANLLPKDLLHPALATEVWYAFSRGNYSSAVLLAFKEVEVAVRDAGGYPAASYGVDLMRQAFHANQGPLTDCNQPQPEREATAHLFAGAIGLYKNPHSHRNVPVAANKAAELIIFASHLLRIIDSRAPLSTTP